ncbi:PA14 domain-containing protein [Chitinophaga filiformis]|uniref:PA14 domain-containing protein n=1 Tax=Chitinophaga filiformis TaxID=104663 RepID=UPI001F233716|nr:PA14 domain-containing protein [Chitinophaga filiformis]MCF6405523.1 PA14 domain-containing protein [Chitinophaga filiformis]
MILALAAKRKKTIARAMLVLLYLEMVIPPFASGAPATKPYYRDSGYAKRTVMPGNRFVDIVAMAATHPDVSRRDNAHVAAPEKAEGGPTQPEMQEFHSVNSDNMVDLFTGDFSYSIPLMDVGGYPIAIGYNSGITMDQEASWTGLGWNLNPGTITRNVRGIPDDFNGTDSVTKTQSIKENKTIGASAGLNLEIVGMDQEALKKATTTTTPELTGSFGVFHNTYRGWGMEVGTGVSLRTAKSGAYGAAGGLGFTSNSQDGLTISPSISASLYQKDIQDKGGLSGSLSIGSAYNSREGMKSIQFSAGLSKMRKDALNARIPNMQAGPLKFSRDSYGGVLSSGISFAYPSYNPSMSVPYTNSMMTITLKAGWEATMVHPSLFLSGYVTKQSIEKEDQRVSLPAYGYLNYQNAAANPLAVLDFNREKDIVYREKPTLPNIGVPSYTYDIFSISGEGVGGSFRGYRSDIGYVYDHKIKTKDRSGSVGVDVGFGNIAHIGLDITYTRSNTEAGQWLAKSNRLAQMVGFRKANGLFEPAYFRNPGEMTVNTAAFYNAVGGDDVVFPKLIGSGPDIRTTNVLTRYAGGLQRGDVQLTNQSVVKNERDKRTQVITYLTAAEAGLVGQSTYIENHLLNKYVQQRDCAVVSNNGGEHDLDTPGLRGEYYSGSDWKKKVKVYERIDTNIYFPDINAFKYDDLTGAPNGEKGGKAFSARWTGRIKAPVSGKYKIESVTDDGIRVFINEKIFIDKWNHYGYSQDSVNLEAGVFYDLRVEYVNYESFAYVKLYIHNGKDTIKGKDLFTPAAVHESFVVIPDTLIREKRVTGLRKDNHISQIEVLSPDGKRNIYGLPVYNIRQKEVTFAVNHNNGDPVEGTVGYTHGTDNTTENRNGVDWYFNSEETPAYPHSFLLTGIVSPDYVDLTGNGISDDDPGNAVKFNYTRTAGADNPFKWRTPYSAGATYNESLKTDDRDDKGSYVYGEKELWYLNSIESKNMIATFVVSDRKDQQPIQEDGQKIANSKMSKRLEEINLYTKADFMKYNTAATPVKTVHFEYTYELCKGYSSIGGDVTTADSTGKLTLKRIWFTYNGNKKGRKNAYVFHYTGKNPGYDHKSFDRWGNYKSMADNPGYTDNNKITNADRPYAVQDSVKAALNAAAWTLDSIVLPSGGRMKITYESDDYGFVQHKRAARMFNIAGFSSQAPVDMNNVKPQLYGAEGDYPYVVVNVPEAVSSNEEVYRKYLSGLDNNIAFRVSVRMPSDKWGKGYEFVPAYADLVPGQYGFLNNGNTIWFKIKTVNKKGEDGGEYTTIAKTAAQFLRLNLPSKAYPGSDVGDNLDLADGVKMLTSMAGNVINALKSFDNMVRGKGWVRDLDLSRSWVRLNVPDYKKYGGGQRVKRIVIYDNWNAMTGRKESRYGTEYEYTTIRNIDGKDRKISSGVATYEPVLGGEENPLRVPIEYGQRAALWAPTNMGYVETPMCESFYPGPAVGYSAVISRSIHNAGSKIKSVTGYKENLFYTAYDFPTFSDYSLLNPDTKKTFKPGLRNLLKIDAQHHLVMSQGFKVELNDMHGKPKAENIYAATDSAGQPGSYTRYYYHVENDSVDIKRLNNTVLSMDAKGKISTDLTIGKDVEVMMDMRQTEMKTLSVQVQANVDVTFAGFAIIGVPTVIAIPQSERNLFRSAAAMKVINRHGIMEKVEAMDKGSKVVTSNLLYDGETGNVLLTATQNEFGDSVFQFNYPAAWMYEGMAGAYKNVNATLDHVDIRDGKIIGGASLQTINECFFSGDEILISGKNKVNDDDCDPLVATFGNSTKIWAVDANTMNGGAKNIYFLDESGTPYTGNDVSLKVLRSGRRNVSADAGTVTMMKTPLDLLNGKYSLNINKDKKIINASAVEYKQNWQVQDRKKLKIICAY